MRTIDIPYLAEVRLELRFRWQLSLLRFRSYLRHSRHSQWITRGVLIGIVAGLAAILFFWLLQTSTHIFLGRLAGFIPPSPVGEGNDPGTAVARRWLLPVVVMLGGLLSGLLVFVLAPEAEGHGTDAAIGAFHHRFGQVRARVIPVKTLASAITIGSGGSGGREGPTAQISAGVASLLAQLLRLDPADRRVVLAAGMGAGIGAIFRAPLGGALLAAEVLYIHDMEVEALLPSLIASIVAYAVFGAWAGWKPIFGAQPNLAFEHPVQLVYYAALGLLCGAVGVAYARTFYSVTDHFARLRLPAWLKPALGGLAVGLLGLAFPEALGTGYGYLQRAMDERILDFPVWLLLLLPFVKIMTTSLSIGSGGSGGIFGPGMVIGGLVGAAFWRLGYGILPSLPATAAPFVIVGMMALFGSIAHAPLATMLMVAEMTGNLSLLAPAMLAVGLATIVVRDETIYRSQLPSRADSPAHRLQFSFPLLSSLRVSAALEATDVLVRVGQRVGDAKRLLAERVLPGLPVVDSERRLVGVVSLTDLEAVPLDQQETVLVEAVMHRAPVAVPLEATLDTALELLSEHRQSWLPVVEGRGGRVVGLVSVSRIVETYRNAARASARRLRGVTADTELLEFVIEPGSPMVGRAVRQLGLPRGVLVVSIQRDGHTVVPRGDTVLRAGDLVLVLAYPEQEHQVRERFSRQEHAREPQA